MPNDISLLGGYDGLRYDPSVQARRKELQELKNLQTRRDYHYSMTDKQKARLAELEKKYPSGGTTTTSTTGSPAGYGSQTFHGVEALWNKAMRGIQGQD